MDDLCSVPNLTEDSLLQDLRLRFEEELIYTYVGNILVSVNPFKFFPIYNPQFCVKYQNRRLGDPLVRPHIFAIADAAFHALVQNANNQCIVISGESGSGKTEAAKMLMYHIMRQSCKASSDGDLNRILGTAPVLEAFGNARTVSNNNSSRFGKFILLQFLQSGAYREASIEKYLLEKSRVISQSPEERNYHIFYFLLAGASQKLKDKLKLTKPEDYGYLNKTLPGVEKCYSVPAIDDKEEFKKLCKSLVDTRFTTRNQEDLLCLVAAILHLGNLEFTAGENGESSIKNVETLSFVGQLLKVEESTLSLSLTQRTSVIRGAEFTTPFQVHDSIDARDATSKALYSYLFDWIVAKVNTVLTSKKTDSKMLSIGLLDIFGFENFKVNSFEQFSINFANEQLQQYFNRHIFSYEQQLYKAEGIEWAEVSFTDNTPCLELISKRPTGILHLLDEESKLSTGGDEKLLEKIAHHHKDNTYFVMPRKKKNSQPAFTVNHYAGAVVYTIGGFRDKNRDLMRPDVTAVLQRSSNSFILQLIGQKSTALKRWIQLVHTVSAVKYLPLYSKSGVMKSPQSSVPNSPSKARRRKSLKRVHPPTRTSLIGAGVADTDELRGRRGSGASSLNASQFRKNKVTTVGGNFMASLASLMGSLSVAEPYFVRCIKSNPGQKPMTFDEKKVMEQLHYLGVVDTIKVRRMGYGLRLDHEDFLSQMRLIIPAEVNSSLPAKEKVLAMLKFWNVEKRVAQVGTTKVFLRNELKERLTGQINDALLKHVLVLQQRARTSLARRRFLALRRSALVIQSNWRKVKARRAMEYCITQRHKRRASAILLQAVVRGFVARKRVGTLRDMAKQEKQAHEQMAKAKEAAAVAFTAAATAAAVRASRVAEAEKEKEAAAAEAAARAAAEAATAAAAAAEEAAKAKRGKQSDIVKAAGIVQAMLNNSGNDSKAKKRPPPLQSKPNSRRSSATLPPSPDSAKSGLANAEGTSMPSQTAKQASQKSYYKRLISNNNKNKKSVKQQGHAFQISMFNLPTMCEHCKEPVVPRLVPGGVCEACHFAVHEKCICSIQKQCKVSKDSDGNMIWEGSVFGASLTQLMSLYEEPVPVLLERCFEQIEGRGLDTQDLYKNIPLNQTKLKALKKQLGEAPLEADISREEIPILCGIVKLFFRELPDPVVPYHMYRDFINTTAVTDIQEQCLEIQELIDILPNSHRFAIQRLIGHLAVIANHRGVTQVSHMLAAVFAPLVLSTPKTVKAAESLKHVKLRLRLLENLITMVAHEPEFLAFEDEGHIDSESDFTGSGFVSPSRSTCSISTQPDDVALSNVVSASRLAPDSCPSSPLFRFPPKVDTSKRSPLSSQSESLGDSPKKLVSPIRNTFQAGRLSSNNNSVDEPHVTDAHTTATCKDENKPSGRQSVSDISGIFNQQTPEKCPKPSASPRQKPLNSITNEHNSSATSQVKASKAANTGGPPARSESYPEGSFAVANLSERFKRGSGANTAGSSKPHVAAAGGSKLPVRPKKINVEAPSFDAGASEAASSSAASTPTGSGGSGRSKVSDLTEMFTVSQSPKMARKRTSLSGSESESQLKEFASHFEQQASGAGHALRSDKVKSRSTSIPSTPASMASLSPKQIWSPVFPRKPASASAVTGDHQKPASVFPFEPISKDDVFGETSSPSADKPGSGVSIAEAVQKLTGPSSPGRLPFGGAADASRAPATPDTTPGTPFAEIESLPASAPASPSPVHSGSRRGSAISLNASDDEGLSDGLKKSNKPKKERPAKNPKGVDELNFDIPEVAPAPRLGNVTKTRAANRGRRPPSRGHMKKMSDVPTIPDDLVAAAPKAASGSDDES